jgi:spore coat protein H
MTDRIISRRRLIEAAAGTLLLSGCSSQDESSTKKTKKQGKIKKADASSETKHLRDKDELYEVYDDSGIVSMYLRSLAATAPRIPIIAGPRSIPTRSTTMPTWA